ncbi:monovalent cation/H(+) antiporter subunit G [Ectothiorhodospira variabilis]|uniref:monovalent cation/H(+) antiporter subunit G n=1 Tax=Ectothiorhodospira variabilis TaxID=505694 RepID=UPI001EFA6517|nr:monovalent cation/H(+) antiporter subunit G [Ectothiorhodospira variabilis]MCG5496989.1 monovalent cation/H(+) antiporter subunit G [Ectothiorhodospira variabilis]
MGPLDMVSLILVVSGLVFFAAGSLGMLRFPDVYTRLHALTKADNLGLGLVVLGLILQVGSLPLVLKLVLIWLLVLFSGAAACHLVAQRALTQGEPESEAGADPARQPRGREGRG